MAPSESEHLATHGSARHRITSRLVNLMIRHADRISARIKARTGESCNCDVRMCDEHRRGQDAVMRLARLRGWV